MTLQEIQNKWLSTITLVLEEKLDFDDPKCKGLIDDLFHYHFDSGEVSSSILDDSDPISFKEWVWQEYFAQGPKDIKTPLFPLHHPSFKNYRNSKQTK